MNLVWIMILCSVMVSAGILGGIVSYFLNQDETKAFVKQDLYKPIVLGVGAAFSVPLFLQLLSSPLVENTFSSEYNVLVFGSYCLVAAIFAKPFLEAVSNQEFKAMKDKVEQTNDIAEKASIKADESSAKINEHKELITQLQNDAAQKTDELSAKVDMHNELIEGLQTVLSQKADNISQSCPEDIPKS